MDRVFLSIWLPPHNPETAVNGFAESLQALPQSKSRPGVQSVRALPLDWAESAAFEEFFPNGAEIDHAVEILREFWKEDYALEAELHWDLWQHTGSEWQLRPSPVTFSLLATGFAEGQQADQGDILVALGFDYLFLADEQPWNEETRKRVQYNIGMLIQLSNAAPQRAHAARRRLWTEDEVDLAQKLALRLQPVQ